MKVKIILCVEISEADSSNCGVSCKYKRDNFCTLFIVSLKLAQKYFPASKRCKQCLDAEQEVVKYGK